MLGRFDEAWALALPAGERLRELSGDDLGEPDARRDRRRSPETTRPRPTTCARYCDMLERRGSRATLSTYAPPLGRSLVRARPLRRGGAARTARPRARATSKIRSTQMLWRQVQALVHAHRGEHAEAERLAREAVAIAERTDALNSQGDALCDLAEVLAAAGRRRRSRRRARAGTRALRAQEEPGHARPSEAEARGTTQSGAGLTSRASAKESSSF